MECNAMNKPYSNVYLLPGLRGFDRDEEHYKRGLIYSMCISIDELDRTIQHLR